MKNLAGFIVMLMLGAGCATPKPPVPPHSGPTPIPPPPVVLPKTSGGQSSQPIVTPDTSLAATVLMCNASGRFVVLRFPSGRLPSHGQILFIYHDGLKTSSVRVTGPDGAGVTIADVVEGAFPRVGDVVRDR